MAGTREYAYKFEGPDPLYCGVCDMIIYFDCYNETALPCCALTGREIKDQSKRMGKCPLIAGETKGVE